MAGARAQRHVVVSPLFSARPRVKARRRQAQPGAVDGFVLQLARFFEERGWGVAQAIRKALPLLAKPLLKWLFDCLLGLQRAKNQPFSDLDVEPHGLLSWF